MNKRPNRTDADLPSQGVIRDSEPSFASKDILLLNDEYLVINKPAKIRMDGAFNHTVEKLICKWLPSLVTTNLKWIHQLDYATSGVLCIGLTRPAAARASLAFAERLTRKQYLAVVRGHINPMKYRASPSSSSSSSYVRLSDDPSSKKTKTAPTIPSDSSLRCKRWQDEAKSTNLSVCYAKFLELLATQQSSGAGAALLDLSILSKRSLAEFEKSAKLRKQLRKALKAYGIHHDFVLPPAEEFSGDGERNDDDDDVITAAAVLDPVAQDNDEDDFSDSIYRLADDDYNSDDVLTATTGTTSTDSLLMVTVPVAEAENDFRCYASRRHGKPCETTLRVLEYASYKGAPVTKVLLLPKTGRRHQLRVHCLALGHPILGDYTYGHEPELEDSTCARMYLHAWKLHVPLTTPAQVKKRKQGLIIADDGLPPTVLVDVCTNDPFTIENGILLDS